MAVRLPWCGSVRLRPWRRRSSSRLFLAPRPDDRRGRQIHRVVAVAAEHRVEFEDADSAFTLDLGDDALPLSALNGGRLPNDRNGTSAFSIVLEVVEAGVVVTNRLAAAAAATGSRVAGRDARSRKPGDADLPVEDCAESV